LDRNWSCHKDAEESLAVTSHSPIAGARLFSEVVTGEEGPWASFASQTVTDWLDLLAQFQSAESRSTEEAAAQRTYVLAVLRGAILDLLATGDISRTSAAITHLTSRLRHRPSRCV
jgi:hypothetical protein